MFILSFILATWQGIDPTPPPGRLHTYSMTANVTAYTAGYESTQKKPGQPGYGQTASGAYVKEGETAACPPSFPFGTRFIIPDLREAYTCEDRGGAIHGHHIDLYFRDLHIARQFGRKNLRIEVVKNE